MPPTVDAPDWLALWDDPEACAAHAGLRYVRDDEPGLVRKPWGAGFTYLDLDGDHLPQGTERDRVEALAIPPAWTDVWICPDPEGHLLATGRDDKGRKQYLYHPAWERIRSEVKFNRLIPFGEALGPLRTRCAHDLQGDALSRTKVLALVVTLLDQTLIRIGNVTYARQNDAYGLTTLRDRHVDFSTSGCVFQFTGKSGVEHCVPFDDPELATLVKECRDVPGYHLFQYYDDADQRGEVHAADVNAYLKETTGGAFTAKDFRTWGGTVHAAITLADAPGPDTNAEADEHITAAVKIVAERLGNTPAVCRQYYIHPTVFESYRRGDLHAAWPRHLDAAATDAGLEPEEQALLKVLRAPYAGS